MAAAMAAENRCAVRDISVLALQEELVLEGVVL